MKLQVTQEQYNAFEEIQRSGLTNMYDHQTVMKLMIRNGVDSDIMAFWLDKSNYEKIFSVGLKIVEDVDNA